MDRRGLKAMVIFISLALFAQACFLRPFGDTTFEKIATKDGKIKATISINPGLSIDHSYIIRGHKWFNTTPKTDFAHLTYHFFILETNGSLQVIHLGGMRENKIENQEEIQFTYVRSYDELRRRFEGQNKDNILFNYSDLD